MDALPHMQFIKVAVTLWTIWYSRRKAIHEGIFQSPQATHMFIDRYIRDLEILKEPRSSPSISAAAVPRGNRRQKVPPAGYAKIHVDAACHRGTGGTAAAVCRDANGNFPGSSILCIAGLDDPAIMETIACREALSLAEDLFLRDATNCKHVSRDIEKGCNGSYGQIISEIKLRAENFNCIFTFERKSSNYEAHSLAK